MQGNYNPTTPQVTASAAILPARIIAFSGTTSPTAAHATSSASRILGVTPPATKWATRSKEDTAGNAYETGDVVGYCGLPFTVCKVQLGGTVTNLLQPLTATAAGKAVVLTIVSGAINTLQWQVGYNLEGGVTDELIDILLDVRPHAAFVS